MFGAQTLHQKSININNKTASAGTEILVVIPPQGDSTRLKVTCIEYKCSTTAHTVRVLKANARTKTSAAVSSGGTTLSLSSLVMQNGDTLATNDYIVYKRTDGVYEARKVTVSGTTVTVAATGGAIAAGNPVWLYGAAGEGQNVPFVAETSAVNTWTDFDAGIAQAGYPITSDYAYPRSGFGDPVLIMSDNATAAGTFKRISAVSELVVA